MSATKETTNYRLPIFEAADQPTWLGDFNGAMNSIDTAIASVGANASTALSAANNAVNRVGQAETTIANVQTAANNAYSISTANKADISALDGQVAQLETKFPIASASLANGAVTASKLDQTAIAAMWAGLTVRRFSTSDSSADNTGMNVPNNGELEGFYIEELGILVVNKMAGTTTGAEEDSIYTLPSYVPNHAATRTVLSCAFIYWTNSAYFDNWTGLYTVKSTRKIRPSSIPVSSGNNFSMVGSAVLYMGTNAGISLNAADAYQRMNPTVG